jgi:hypothetical protein
VRKQTNAPKKTVAAVISRLVSLAFVLIASAMLAQPSTAGTAIASFVASDASTLGNWHGVYGTDGYVIANNSQSIPSYAAFSVQPQNGWTWAAASSTVDPRALQTGNNTGNIAATWYNQTSFYMDLNLTDATPHQIAVYLLDWDFQGRSETVRIVDPTTNTQLDSKTISGFANGIYLIWNISGHVHISITTNSGPNSVVSGIFFATTSGVNVKPGTINLSAAKTQQFTASVPSSTNQNVTWSMTPSVGTISSSGLYTAPATISAAQTITVTATSAADTTKFSSAMVGLVPGSAVANFVSFDTTTKGNWSGLYGADGYSLANANQKLPSYGSSTTVQNQLDWVWASSTTDPRALKIPGGSSALAATWYNPGSFNFDVNLTDGHSHQVAFYAVDWDSTSRSETVQILDATTNAVLDTETIAKFSGGVYAIWNISGHVKVVVSDASYPNSVVSGVFFGGISTGSSTSSASTTSSGTSNVLPVVPPPTTSSSTSGSTSSTTSSTTGTSSGSTTPVPPAVGTLTANASSISFGSINIGSSSAKTISVSNTGTANVTIVSDSIGGAGLNASGASGVVLTPGQSTTLNVTFTPASAGNVSGSLTLASNASNSSLSIVLSGTGVPPPPTTYSVALTWNTSSSTGIVGYNVFRGSVQGGAYTQLTSTPLAGTTYTDTTAQAGQTYYYAVTSVDSSSVQSSYSNVANVNVP